MNDPNLTNRLAKQVRWQVYSGLGHKDLKPLLAPPSNMESMTYEQYLLSGAKAVVESGEPDYTLTGWITGVTPTAALLWLPTAAGLDASTSLMADYLDTTRYVWHYWPPFTAPESITTTGPKSCE